MKPGKFLFLAFLFAPSLTHAQAWYPVSPAPTVVTPTTGGTQAAIGGTITAANAYQQIVAANSSNVGGCQHGGMLSITGGGQTYIDFTVGVAAGSTALGPGAIGPFVPGTIIAIPPTNNAIFVFGPSGTTFRGYCS